MTLNITVFKGQTFKWKNRGIGGTKVGKRENNNRT
jgi:hypothetical protein